jgi:RNA polymerase sigma-70 factor (ECF subfamily)
MITATHPDFVRALRAAKDGDCDAFDELWRASNPRLLRYLRVIAPGLSTDVASATWVNIARSLDCFPADEPGFNALMIRIARDEAAIRRRVGHRRPDRIIDLVEAEAADRAGSLAAGLPTETAVRLLGRLPSEIAEMVALRVVVGLDAQATAELIGQRPGSVRVAVQRGLRRTADLLGRAPQAAAATAAAATAAATRTAVAPLDPWALDRLLGQPDLLDRLDPSMRLLVAALSVDGSAGNVSGLTAARRAFRDAGIRPGSHRRRMFGPLLLLPLLTRQLGRRLSTAKSMLGGKIAAVAVGTLVLSAPAAVAYSGPGADRPSPTPVSASAPLSPSGRAGLGLPLARTVGAAAVAPARQPASSPAPRRRAPAKHPAQRPVRHAVQHTTEHPVRHQPVKQTSHRPSGHPTGSIASGRHPHHPTVQSKPTPSTPDVQRDHSGDDHGHHHWGW